MNSLVRELAYGAIVFVQRVKNRTLTVRTGAKCTMSSRFEGYNKLDHHSFFSGELGYASYIGAKSVIIGKIGRFCSFAENVTFLTKTHPVKGFVSTHPCFYSLKKQSGFTFVTEQAFDEDPLLENSRYSIEVGNDVYIGYGATIIGPVRIGDGAVIAAGAVVTGDVPAYAITGGVPAKVIRYRFPPEEIAFLERIRWWDMPQTWLREHAADFRSLAKLRAAMESEE